MVEEGRSPEFPPRRSFVDIVERLKEDSFQIMAGVDSEEVWAFARQVESAE
jgi:hypothetical protein